MEYIAERDILALAAFGLTLILMAMVGTRLDKKRKAWTCPAWLGVMTRGYYKLLNGYDPAMPHGWTPDRNTVVTERKE